MHRSSTRVAFALAIALSAAGSACKSTRASTDAGYDTCKLTEGCFCPKQDEGKSFCLYCGMGYQCLDGHRVLLWDGPCDALSPACRDVIDWGPPDGAATDAGEVDASG
jgi:hypothetical protein